MVYADTSDRGYPRRRQDQGTFPSKSKQSIKFEDDDGNAEESKTVAENKSKKPYRSPFEQRADAQMKSWRLIIRNLPFNTTKEDLQNAFSKFGPFREIVLPKCKDPRYPDSCAGFGFVQYVGQGAATTARNNLNMTELNGRKVAVDWAIPKDTYDTAVHEEKQQSASKAKDTKAGASNKPSKATKFEEDDDEEDKDDKAAGSGDDDEEEEESNEEDDEEAAAKEMAARKRARNEKPEKAVEEGRALFVRNLTFETESEGLKEKLQEFGDIELAVICKYPGTDHSKGSGFVYFKQREDADKCLAELETEEGVMLDGRKIYGHRAIPRNEASDMEKAKLQKNPKDNRNLHLLRVGSIRPGTAQAKNMSESDSRKRANLEMAARDKIKNLHMFVSPTRLVVHNLPPSVNDKQLKSLCFTATNDVDAKIVECRIWRDMQKLTTSGEGKSRGFGFVAFTEHRHALACLQALNNNPETFTDAKRPIVEFSIENMSALNKRKARIEKSKNAIGKKRTSSEVDSSTAAKRSKTDLDTTKREMAAGGRKAFASHVGPKIRHRDMAEKKKKKQGGQPMETGKKGKAPKNKKSRKVVRAEKAGRKDASLAGSKRKLTKFLALS